MRDVIFVLSLIAAFVGAIKCRHRHNGSMADYKYAMALVTRVRNGKEGPELASWF